MLYLRAPRLFETLLQSKADGSHLKTLTRLAKIQLLILDDLFLTPLSDAERNDLLEIIEDRHQKAPTVITSQCPIKNWHHIIGEPTVADAILDRIEDTLTKRQKAQLDSFQDRSRRPIYFSRSSSISLIVSAA